MGKTTQADKIAAQAKQKADKGTSKPPAAHSNIQRRKKSRSCSTRRVSVTTDPPTTTSDQTRANQNQTRAAADVSDNEEDQNGQLNETSKKTSAVHKFATKISKTDYQCIQCSKVIRCSTDSSANIRRHLASVHGKTELGYTSHTSRRSSIPPEKKRLLDELAIRCIIMDGRSWGDFRREGMLKFLSAAIPGYYGPCGRTVQRNLSKIYMKKKAELKQKISKMSNFSITTDMWKSKRNRHYLCVTLHSVDEHFASESQVLSFRKFHGRSFAKSIRVHLEQVINEFGLSGKIISTTTDNGSNIKLATSKRKLFGVRIYCLAHALNLTVHNGLHLWIKKKKADEEKDDDEEIEDDEEDEEDDESNVQAKDANNDDDDQLDEVMIDINEEANSSPENSDDDLECVEEDDNSSLSSSDGYETSNENNAMVYDISALMIKCRSIISTIRKSSILHDMVLAFARDASIKLGLVLDMKIRWNSTFKMIHRLLLYKNTLHQFYEQLEFVDGITGKQKERLRRSKLSQDDWNVVHVLHRILERFNEATTIISGQKYPTLSLAYAVNFSLCHYLNTKSTDTIENGIKEMLLEPFRKYMIRDGKESEVMRVAAFLDPLTHCLVLGNDKKMAEALIVKEVKEQQRRASADLDHNLNQSQGAELGTSSMSSTHMSIDPVERESIIRNFFSKCGIDLNTTSESSKVLTIEQELAKLVSIPKGDIDCMSFWRAHKESMPQLAVLARKYLSISATSVPCESTFSISNHVLRKNRLSLSSKNIRYTMFLKDKLN